jgi:D-alanyl-D-alanine carboxypeptidase (penicillin-binding protein 5/6)
MRYTRQQQPKRFPFGIIIFIVALIYVMTMLLWPVQAIEATIPEQPAIDTGPAPTMSWPSYGQSAIGTNDTGVLATNGTQTPTPIASITKTITALVVLEKKPITPGQTGPTITLTTEDAVRYNQYFLVGGSIARSDAGMKVTEYQMLQAALISSANNYADSLAIWAYGSMDAYLKAATDYLAKHNLTNTTVADATGFSPNSVSTASDLVLIGALALKNPVIADIVSQKSAVIDAVGTLNNTNLLLGQEGVVGIKTGTTDEAGSCLLYAARYTVGSETVTVIGATLGAPNHALLARNASTVLSDAKAGFKEVMLAKKGEALATYTAPWGATARAVTEKNIKVTAWSGQTITAHVNAKALKAGDNPKNIGSATFSANDKKYTADLVLDQPIATPSWLWRLTHPTTIIKS